MPPLPPTDLVLGHLQHAVLPAAGCGAVVLCAFLVLGRWAGALGSAAAVAAAFMTANLTLDNLRGEKPTWANTARLIPWMPAQDAAAWQWLPRVALILVAVGLLTRWSGLLAARRLPERYWWGANLFVWVPRVAGVAVLSGWLVIDKVAAENPWLRPQLATIMVLSWVALDSLARSGCGGQVAAYFYAMFMAAGAILIYSHTGRFMEVAVVLGSGMFGIAVAAGAARADASGAVPAGVAFLPGLLLATRPSLAEHNVPAVCFWLVALAPLMLTPFLVPTLARKNGWVTRACRAALVLAPLVAAVLIAGQHEKLVFEEEW